MSEQEATKQEIVEAIYAGAAEEMANGKTDEEIQKLLLGKGLEEDVAAQVISDLHEMRREGVRRMGKRKIFFGALFVLWGVLATAVIATFGVDYGIGLYFVAGGIAFVGYVLMKQGMAKTKSNT